MTFSLAKALLLVKIGPVMARYLYFVGKDRVKVWGLTVPERLKRLLGPETQEIESPENLRPEDEVFVFNVDYLLDDRVVKYLTSRKDFLLFKKEGRKLIPLAAHVTGKDLSKALSFFASGNLPQGLEARALGEISAAFFKQLRKFEPPFALKLTEENRAQVERRLYDWSYKGVTDLVTKWLWPRPARLAVKLCVRLGLKPNHVTFLGAILVVLAGYLFYQGHLGLGLLAAWFMTFLDTVDGKLARVTVTSSRFGHYFDHLIDLIHPPIWYILWGLGAERLGAESPLPLSLLSWLLVGGYVLGRLVEGAFMARFGFEIFCWRPFDSFFRLVTARRNPCLIILTGSYLLGRPELGLLAVTFWTVLTSLVLLLRLLQALWEARKGPLVPWLSQVDQYPSHSLARKWFTREATA